MQFKRQLLMGVMAIVGAWQLVSSGCSTGTATVDGGAGAVGDATQLPDAGPRADAPPSIPETAVYAHSSTELFQIDPDTLVATSVGMFSFTGASENITDIALDKMGKMIGISLNSVYAIDRDTAATTLLAQFAQGQGGLTSLSFVPVDLDRPDSAERLVAADFAGVVWEIDPATGGRTVIGNYNATGTAISSSGDIVSVVGFGTLATVRIEGSTTDHLARLDPTTWQAIVLGDTGKSKIFGLGFWAGKVFGLADNNEVLSLDPLNGRVLESKPSTVRWWGAGVTTLAPIVE